MINSLDPVQTRQNIGSDLGPNGLTQDASQFRPSGLDPNCLSHGTMFYLLDPIVIFVCLI